MCKGDKRSLIISLRRVRGQNVAGVALQAHDPVRAVEIDPREKLYVTLRNAGFHLSGVFGPLLSKICSAYSVMKVYGPKGFEVIKVYAVGGKAHVYNVRIEGRRAAGMAAWLAKLIEPRYVMVKGKVVFVDSGGERLAVPLEDLLSAPYAPTLFTA